MMYQQIYEAFDGLSKGDVAELKRCNLQTLANTPAYFRVLKYSGAKDNAQAQRILFVFVGIDLGDDEESYSVAQALLNAQVKEGQIIQIIRSGDNGLDYLKRQLVRCKKVNKDDLGQLAQYWGDRNRRTLLKNFILLANDPA